MESQASKHRTKNYSPQEDEAIARAWLAVSDENVTVGNHSYWDRIFVGFNAVLGSDSERSANGLQCRWHLIQRDVIKFCALISTMEGTNSSGATLTELVIDAKKNFYTTEKTHFKFESCWYILKDTPKWNHLLLSKTAKKRKPTSNVQQPTLNEQNPPSEFDGFTNAGIPILSMPTTPGSGSAPLDENCDPFFPDQDGMSYPMETKGEKGRRKRNSGYDQTSMFIQEFLNIFQASLQKQREVSLREIQFKEECARQKHELLLRDIQYKEECARQKDLRACQKRYKEDQKIMEKDLTGLLPEQREYFIAKQREIWERWQREGQLPAVQSGSGLGGSSEEKVEDK